ncbi:MULTISPECIES: UDP-N-acetylglucosamine 1-carboxyvinyltransferase [Caproicibacterium]|uniref:UDP-N-acetylglucosamine 1-carboxyvinyltransferase n=1 Tax=Caproicibacterium argilliputei TaxID=3030016 RepID=A0AA97H4E2_9FIRM|nr:UDP-N-acetylglucosamine 1-carboxyvinyltransferase [Caproicibacterium argilliputei]WOC33333.1 UDP-N-acetylglucosamine 1-carboxyvinyltransferase [Caproicibacterium argilliputei]
MDKFLINGGKQLKGEVMISGAKNAAIAIIPAAILSDEPCRIENVPHIKDVNAMVGILHDMGADIRWMNRSTLQVDARPINTYVASYELARQMRGSYYLLGALLGRFHHAVVSMPGGCDFGVRPIDQHLKGFSALGAEYTLEGGMVNVSAQELRGSSIYLDVVSVGATINIMLAAVKASGVTVIENAAKEPHIVDLANFLNTMGADIRGAGTDVIKVYGVEHLRGVTYSIIPDQIEAGTYMVAGAATHGDVTVTNVIPKHLESITAKLEEMGLEVTEYDEAVRVRYVGKLNKCNIKTMPHPGFPTDMQPQITVLLSLANGTSIVNESIWDNRFRYVDELKRMGAQVSVDGKLAVVEGIDHLNAAPVKATDLRAGAALIIAALAAHGTSEIERIRNIERGYEHIVEKLQGIGAEIRRVTVQDKEEAQAV